jgi:glutathione peroxidase-family protein
VSTPGDTAEEYALMQHLHDSFGRRGGAGGLVILALPSDQFGGQEPGRC